MLMLITTRCQDEGTEHLHLNRLAARRGAWMLGLRLGLNHPGPGEIGGDELGGELLRAEILTEDWNDIGTQVKTEALEILSARPQGAEGSVMLWVPHASALRPTLEWGLARWSSDLTVAAAPKLSWTLPDLSPQFRRDPGRIVLTPGARQLGPGEGHVLWSDYAFDFED